MTRHITQTKIQEADDAIRGGRRLEDVAGELGVDPSYLARLIGLPALQPVPDDSEESFCIFEATEKLETLL